MKSVFLAIMVVWGGVGCSSSSSEEPDVPSSTDTGGEQTPEKIADLEMEGGDNLPFHLYVSNQSFDINPVDIDIFVDDVHVVEGDFRVEGQHNWLLFEFHVAPGSHTLRAESTGASASLTQEMEVSEETWAVFNFWHDDNTSRSFTFHHQNTPIGFD